MKTKKEMFEEITPIEYSNMFDQKVVSKRLNSWTKEGLSLMKELWHKHYTTSAHRLICACVLSFKQKDVDFNKLEIALMESI